MVDDSLTFGLNVETDADKAAKGFKLLSDHIDDVTASASKSKPEIDGMWKGLNRLETAFGKAPASVKKYSDAFSNLRKEVSEAEKAMQSYAQKRVSAGGVDPMGSSVNRMSASDARRNLAVGAAGNLSIEAVSKERLRLEDQLNRAKAEGAAHDRNMLNLGKDRLTVAKENLAAAQKELASAQGRMTSSGGRHAGGSSITDQVNAEKNLAAAKKGVYAAQVELNSATTAGAASLPTLRYAMYDVARTAGIMSTAIAGAGAGLLAASASYETSFTAVERTSGVTGAAVGELRDDLLGLARTIPQSFGEIADLAARGAQLGVASDGLAGFTETVAQFVATSDTVSLDQAVEAFGRISNLTGDTNFNALGSAITLVGVNAAATEGQIVKTTQELAPFAASAGIASHEVVGLATAVASLGQPPERARSAFLSLQSTMDGALAGTNDKLTVFADLLGLTADETAKLWKNDPSQFISSFAAALGSVENMTGALSDLGLSEKRASQVFQALAADSRNAGDGLSVLDQALTDSEKGYKDGTELARQYGLIVDDLSSKWQLFLNSAMELASALGDNLAPAAKAALDMITPFINRLADMAKSPIAKVVTTITAALVALGGTLLGGIALWAASKAAIAGAQTALAQLGATGGVTSVTLKGLSASLTETALAAGVSSRAINVFKVALASTGIGLAVVALGTLASAFMQAGVSAEDTFNKYLGTAGGLAEALQADMEGYTAAVAEGNQAAIDSYTKIASASEAAVASNEGFTQEYRDAATLLGVDLPSAVSAGTSAIENQTAVLGENTLAWMRSSLMQSESFQKLFEDTSFLQSWEAIGADFNTVMQIAASEGAAGVENYFISLSNATADGGGATLKGFQLFHYHVQDLMQQAWASMREFWGKVVTLDWGNLGKPVVDFGTKLGQAFKGNAVLTKPLRELSQLAGGIGAMARESSGASRPVSTLADDLEDLGGSGGDAAKGVGDTADKVRTLKDYASDLSSVWSRAFEIRFSGQQTIDAVRDSIQKLRDAAEASAKRVTDLRNSIRSLSADAQALQSDISILEYYLRIANEYGDQKRATALEAELAKKRAELASKTSELADKNKELKKEQDSQNKTLVGNSQAARDNRKSIQDLVQQYQAHIGALAASGMSQEELARATARLKQDFINQATQLGYNRGELVKFASAFDDVSAAIKAVPPINISVKGLTPAQIALKEMEKSVNNLRNKVGGGIDIPVRTSIDQAGAAKAARLADLQAQLAGAQKDMMLAIQRNAPGSIIAGFRDKVMNLSTRINSGNYWDGGFTGRGGKYEPKGIVHGGEYVFRKDQVDQSTGLPTQAALMSMMPTGSLPSRTVAPSMAGTGGGAAMVSLTPATIQAIAQALPTGVILDGNIVGEVSSREYARSNAQGSY